MLRGPRPGLVTERTESTKWTESVEAEEAKRSLPGSARLEGECSSIERAGAESREGIKPSHAVLQTALLSENRLGAGRGNRTHIGSLEDCGPTVERCPRKNDDPVAGREGIEPSPRVLEAQPVTMTLRPRRATKPGAW